MTMFPTLIIIILIIPDVFNREISCEIDGQNDPKEWIKCETGLIHCPYSRQNLVLSKLEDDRLESFLSTVSEIKCPLNISSTSDRDSLHFEALETWITNGEIAFDGTSVKTIEFSALEKLYAGKFAGNAVSALFFRITWKKGAKIIITEIEICNTPLDENILRKLENVGNITKCEENVVNKENGHIWLIIIGSCTGFLGFIALLVAAVLYRDFILRWTRRTIIYFRNLMARGVAEETFAETFSPCGAFTALPHSNENVSPQNIFSTAPEPTSVKIYKDQAIEKPSTATLQPKQVVQLTAANLLALPSTHFPSVEPETSSFSATQPNTSRPKSAETGDGHSSVESSLADVTPSTSVDSASTSNESCSDSSFQESSSSENFEAEFISPSAPAPRAHKEILPAPEDFSEEEEFDSCQPGPSRVSNDSKWLQGDQEASFSKPSVPGSQSIDLESEPGPSSRIKTVADLPKFHLDSFKRAQGLAEGSFGACFLMTHRSLGKTVAKLFKEEVHTAEKLLQSRELELNVYLRRSPHVVKILGTIFVTKEEEIIGFLMEFCGGGDLFEFIKRTERPEKKLLNTFMYQMSQAIAYIHRKGVVHRDIKPENLFLSEDLMRLKLGDFGLARKLPKNEEKQTRRLSNLLFCAPDQYNSDNYTTSVDVYSFGAVCYFLFYQKDLYDESKYPEGFFSDDTAKILSQDWSRPELSGKEADFIIRQCWQGNASARPPMSSIVDILDNEKGKTMFPRY